MSDQRDFFIIILIKIAQKKDNHEAANLAQRVVDTHPFLTETLTCPS